MVLGIDPGLRNIGVAALSTVVGAPIAWLPPWRPHSVKHQPTPEPVPVDPDGWLLANLDTIPLPAPPKGLDGPGTARVPHDGNNRRSGFILGSDVLAAYNAARKIVSAYTDRQQVLAVGYERIPYQLNRADGEGSVGAVAATTGAVLSAIHSVESAGRDGCEPLFAEANQIRVKQWACELSSDVTQKVPETAPLDAFRRMAPAAPQRSTDHSVDAALVALYTLAGLLAFSDERCGCGSAWGVAGWMMARPQLRPRRWCPNCGVTPAKPPRGAR